MAPSVNFIRLVALISACCLVTEARRSGKTREVRHVVGAPQKQTMFDIPFDQVDSAAGSSAGGSAAGSSVAGGSEASAGASDDGADSESSEESDLEMDMDMDTADINEVDGPAIFGGNGNQVGGNLLPFLSDEKGMASQARNTNSILSRTSGSSGRGVGIAFGVLVVVVVVVAAAAFTLRKYRHNIPVYMCV